MTGGIGERARTTGPMWHRWRRRRRMNSLRKREMERGSELAQVLGNPDTLLKNHSSFESLLKNAPTDAHASTPNF